MARVDSRTRGVSAEFLTRFIDYYGLGQSHVNVYQIMDEIVKPATGRMRTNFVDSGAMQNFGCPRRESLNGKPIPWVGRATCFVSYNWLYKQANFISAVLHYDKSQPPMMPPEFYYIDFLFMDRTQLDSRRVQQQKARDDCSNMLVVLSPWEPMPPTIGGDWGAASEVTAAVIQTKALQIVYIEQEPLTVTDRQLGLSAANHISTVYNSTDWSKSRIHQFDHAFFEVAVKRTATDASVLELCNDWLIQQIIENVDALNNPEMLDFMHQLGAKSGHFRQLKSRIEMLESSEDKQAAAIKYALGRTNEELRDVAAAFTEIGAAAQMYQTIDGELSPSLARCLLRQSLVCEDTHDALGYLHKAAEIVDIAYGHNSLQSAQVQLRLGDLHMKMGKLEEAIKYFGKCISLISDIFGAANHPLMAEVSHKMALCRREMGLRVKAIHHHEEEARVWGKLCGPQSMPVAAAYERVAALHASMGHNEAAIQILEEVLMIKKARLGRHHGETRAVMDRITLVGNRNTEQRLHEKMRGIVLVEKLDQQAI